MSLHKSAKPANQASCCFGGSRPHPEHITLKQLPSMEATRKPLLVIGAGFPRSGTTSSKVALQMLTEGTCHHMVDCIKNLEQEQWAALYKQGWQEEGDNILRLLQSYSSCVDIPSMLYWKELLAAHPNAKVLLTVRDSFDQWHESIMHTVYSAWRIQTRVPAWVDYLNPPSKNMGIILSGLLSKDGLFKGRFEDKEFARGVYEAYIEDVKRTVPPDQLLVFNVKEGWAPLCKFLGVPVPSKPFPKVNDTEQFKQMLPPLRRKLGVLTYGPPAAVLGLAAAISLAAQLVKRR